MIKDNDLLFKQITEKIGNTDFSGYTIQYPPMFCWKRVDEQSIKEGWLRLIKNNNISNYGLYVHIPFCKTRCTYCRYFSIELKESSMVDDYLDYLEIEAKIFRKIFKNTKLRTVYIGGGTPSLLTSTQLRRFFKIIYNHFELSHCIQICFEGNPDFLDLKKIKILKLFGVNRLTIGVQSLDPKVIKAVNRYQSSDSFLKCYKAARKAKIKNINIDVMIGLPSQTISSVVETLNSVIKLKPEMIHVHPFYPTGLSEFIKGGQQLMRRDMQQRKKMALISQQLIQAAGYKPIKFDADGRTEAARNIQLSDAIEYNAPFLGLGSGAVSHVTNYVRYVNTSNLNEYGKTLKRGKLPVLSGCRLSKRDEMIYFVTACLRYGGVDKAQFKKLFQEDLDRVFRDEIELLEKRKKIINSALYLYSKMKDIGEYLIFSKYFYDKNLIKHCSQILHYNLTGKIKREDVKYMLL